MALAAHGHEVGHEWGLDTHLLTVLSHRVNRDRCLLLHDDHWNAECMSGAREGSHVEERVRRQDDEIKRALQVETTQLTAQPGVIPSPCRSDVRIVVRVQPSGDSGAHDAYRGCPEPLIRKPSNIESWIGLKRSQILI